MIKYGIKLWAINENYFSEAVGFYKNGLIDFIELYIVPDKVSKRRLNVFKDIPVQIHAPHSLHNFNIFELDKEKINLFKNQVIKIADFLNSKYIVLHAGIGNDSKIFKKNIKKIYDRRIIIENNPKIALDDRICFGYSYKQLKFIKKQCKLNICLDIAHAIKSAISQKKDYKKYLKTLIKILNPDYFHISDGLLTHEKDEHLNLGKGHFDLKWIKDILVGFSKSKNISIVFEVPKNKHNLKNDITNKKFYELL